MGINTAKIDGQGNITVQGNKGPVTIHVNDPNLVDKLAAQGQSLEEVKQLLLGQMGSAGNLQLTLEKLLLRFPQAADIPILLEAGSRKFRDQLRGKTGRFGHLDISEHILGFYDYSVKRETPDLLKPDEILSNAWKDKSDGHSLLIGQEGTGKTVSMLWLWDHYLNKEDSPIIPIYIPLSEYNQAGREVQEKFIIHYIATNYLGVKILENNLETSLWAWLEQEVEPGSEPKLVLLLDGLNEITADITPLLIDLNEKWVPIARKSGIQLMVTSRYKSNHKFADGFSVWAKQPLRQYCIKRYIKEKKLTRVINFSTLDPTLQELLTIPMMLALFVGVAKEAKTLNIADLKPTINSTPELIWNFLAIKLARFEDNNKKDPDKCTRAHFLIYYLLPFIAYEMEQAQRLEIKEKELERSVNAAFSRFCEPEFFKEFSFRKNIKRYRQHINALKIGALPLIEEIGRFEELLEEFMQELYPVAQEQMVLRFTHQSFQEFFAAIHLLNEINLSLEKGSLPHVLKDAILAPNLQKTLGEIIGEHYNKPEILPKGKQWRDYYLTTSLVQVLGLCRGKFDRESLGYTVWNILSIWKKVRGTFAGADLSNLHLSGFDFNGIDCVQTTPDGALVNSNWDNSRLSPKQWFPQGHEQDVNKVRVSPDGKYLASASADHTIKLWLVSTNEYIRTFHGRHGHHDEVYELTFSPDGKKLLTGAADGKLIEWSVATGECLQVYRGHQEALSGLAYHPTQAKAFSAAKDGTVRAWSTITGKCLFTHKLSDSDPKQCLSLAKEGSSILVGSKDGPIVALSSDLKQEVQRFEQSNVLALSNSPCGKKFVAVSITNQDRPTCSIQEWSLINGKLIQVFKFAEPLELSDNILFVDATYNPSGEYLLVCGLDENIYEWAIKDPLEVEEHLVTQTFVGHVRRTTSMAYHPEGEHLFSGSYDGTLKKWAVASGQVLHNFPPKISPYNAILEVPDINCLFACSENGTIHRWNIGADHPVREQIFGGGAPAYGIALYTGGEAPLLVTGSKWGLIEVWNLAGKCVRTFSEHQHTISSLIVDSETGLVISGDDAGHLIGWSLKEETLAIRPSKNENKSAITCMAFSPNPQDTRFATSYESGDLIIWSPEPKVKPKQLVPIWGPFHHDGHHPTEEKAAVYAMDFDGEHVVSGGTDGKIKEWDINRKEIVQLDDVGEDNIITFMAYHPDKSKLLFGDYVDWQLFELPLSKGTTRNGDKEAKVQYEGHQNYVLDALYRPKDQSILTIAQDAVLRKWDSSKQELQWSIKNIPGLKVKHLDFSEVYWIEPLTDEEFELLQSYGAKFEDTDSTT